jgi:signal transduction histidine kinase
MHAFEMDVEAILLNLLANAYTFAQESRSERRIRLEVHPGEVQGDAGVEIIVADSGPGVPENRREVIWEPLYTTRRDAKGNEVGTGLGLAIIDSIVRETGGRRSVDRDPVLGGARFQVWTPSKWVNA